MKKINLFAICCILCFVFTACSNGSATSATFELNLSEIKNENAVFCYKNLEWDITSKETQSALKIDLGKATTSTIEQGDMPSFVSSVYFPSTEIKLLDKVGNSTFEYRDDKLTSILFSFAGKTDDMTTFANSVLNELKQIYSDDYEVNEQNSEKTGTKTNVYKWKLPYGERTSYLQLITTQKGETYSVSVGVLCPNKKTK